MEMATGKASVIFNNKGMTEHPPGNLFVGELFPGEAAILLDSPAESQSLR